ncbi:flagellar biosynthesis protein FlhF [Paenibacillus methanolicus]|uniref:Flagellar biosynthesis protein FlhF n=1 Tax=Paenibacillus methanolicus TaxID=582686 RepID=A0A5S5CE68_9BACL|nr:flagellar biosynthesis protein FlhF [Paenibacillus methanolicus]TYP77637.1 flagellar biosynthesis protein FlhF [Paenibacillus methanolicus]
MKVKRYIVNALPEALPMIRSELGADAVILNTKEIRIGGFLGMFAKKKMEVIAAVETGSAKPAPKAQTPASAKPQPQLSPTEAQSALLESLGLVRGRQQESAGATAVLSPPVTSSKAAAAAYGGARPADSRPASPQPAMQPVPPPPAALRSEAAIEKGNAKLDDAALLDEIRDMKQWIVRMSKQQQMKRLPEPVQALHARLIDQEVNADLIEKLISEVTEMVESVSEADLTQADVWAQARTVLTQWMSGKAAKGIQRDTRVIHFVGPTGVGKTTSIAKLAAEQTLKSGRKVGFITSDTYRIAAVDQLRTYANILNVPLEVVFSPAEVSRAFKDLEDRELIFMDTAGRNFRNELYVSEVNSLLQTNHQSETYLVLSLTSKFKDMSVVAGHFAKYGIEKVLYTKQDETDAYGAILNLAVQYDLHPAYIAYGQTVPDDITTFKTDVYVEQLLGAYEQ